MSARILVVDDEPDIEALLLQKFRREIRDDEFAFNFARDGVDALAAVAGGGNFDMVISDINMPRMDGLTLLQRLAEAEPELTTVILSAYGDMGNIRIAMNRGAFDFVTKPIDFADFEITLRKALAHVENLRQARLRASDAERAHASLSRYFSPSLADRLAAGAAIDLRGPAPTGFIAIQRRHWFYWAGRVYRARVAGAIAQRISRRHDRDRFRPRGHCGCDHRRRTACAIRSTGRPAGPCAAGNRLRYRNG